MSLMRAGPGLRPGLQKYHIFRAVFSVKGDL